MGRSPKALTQVSNRRNRDKALAAMAKNYRRDRERALENRRLNPYGAGQRSRRCRRRGLLNKAEAAGPADEADPGFWNLITVADATLGRRLPSADDQRAEWTPICGRGSAALRHSSSPRCGSSWPPSGAARVPKGNELFKAPRSVADR
jgi:hypothetical protein